MTRLLRFQITAIAFIRTVMNTMHRMVYPFLPIFSRGLGVDLSGLSLALTTRQMAGFFAPFISILLENRGRKTAMLTGLGIFTTGVVLVVLSPSYPVFFLTLILTTLGKYIFDPHMQGFLGDRVPYERRGLAIAVTELGWSFAFILGVPLMGFLISRGGWLSPFSTLSILGTVSIVLIGKIIPSNSDDRVNWGQMWRNITQVLRHPSAIAALSISFGISAGNEVVTLVFGVWLEDVFGLQVLALSGAAAAIGLAELGGETLMGGITDRLGKERSIGWGIAANCVAAAIFPILGKTLSGAVIALFLFYITFEFTLVAIIPMMSEIMPNARVTLLAFNVSGLSLGRAIGALVASPIYKGGIAGSALAAIIFNMIALFGLYRLWKITR
jgi:predicted MFS family arabinose efflux permease